MDDIKGALIGGGFTIAGIVISAIIQCLREKREKKERIEQDKYEWGRDHKLAIYIELADALGQLCVCIDETTKRVDTETIAEHMAIITQTVDKNKGKMALFLPDEINSELMHLRSEIYSIYTIKEKQKIDYDHFLDSPIMLMVKHAKRIEILLRRDLLDN